MALLEIWLLKLLCWQCYLFSRPSSAAFTFNWNKSDFSKAQWSRWGWCSLLTIPARLVLHMHVSHRVARVRTQATETYKSKLDDKLNLSQTSTDRRAVCCGTWVRMKTVSPR